MPTTLRSSSTTGDRAHARSSRAARSRVRASSSGETLGTSASMISAAVFIARRDYSTGASGRRPAGIESITSVAITDSAAPIRRGRVAAGAGVGEDRGAGGGEGLEAAGEQRRGDARRGRRRCRRSPGPGAESALTATRSPSVTIVSSPLSTTTAPAARGGLAGGGEPVGGDLLRVAPEQAAELAGVRGEDRRRLAGGDPAELAGEGVEAVGVDHQRRLDRGRRPRGPARPSRGRGPGRGRGRPAAARSKARSTAFAEAGARQPSPPGQPTDITSGWPARRSARGRRGRRRSRSRRRPGSPPARTSAPPRSGRASRRRSSPGRS